MNVPFYVDFHLFIASLTKTLEARDSYTAGHSDRVAELSSHIAESAGFDGEEVFKIHVAAHLHDIGKIGVPDCILLKEGKLTSREFECVKKHTEIGFGILREIPDLTGIAEVVLHHHERYDGKGYPAGLSGVNIPVGSRIIAIADSFDAMVTNRPYRKRLSVTEALYRIEKEAGTQFDPGLTGVFLSSIDKFLEENGSYETGRIGRQSVVA